MVKVYFETSKDGHTPDGSYSEMVAIFDSEQTYNLCLNLLEKEAERYGMIVTEVVEEENSL